MADRDLAVAKFTKGVNNALLAYESGAVCPNVLVETIEDACDAYRENYTRNGERRSALLSDAALMALAKRARAASYSPYSRFAVGAALLTADGAVYHGCNVESASYGLTTCAERVALQTAVCAGERRFVAIAIVGGPHGEPPNPAGVAPCGACRQVLAEFGTDLRVILPSTGGRLMTTTLGDLLPRSFGPADLGVGPTGATARAKRSTPARKKKK